MIRASKNEVRIRAVVFSLKLHIRICFFIILFSVRAGPTSGAGGALGSGGSSHSTSRVLGCLRNVREAVGESSLLPAGLIGQKYFQFRFHDLLIALRADAVTELRVGVLADVALDGLPVILVVTDFLA